MPNKSKKSGKVGSSVSGHDARITAFVEAYLTNGHNATEAMRASGYSGNQIANAAWRMMQKPEVQKRIAQRSRKVAELAEMNTENWARELRAIAFANVGDLYDENGKLIPVHQLPRHVQAALAPVKLTEDGVEYKFKDGGKALETIARHLGLFERDNAQQQRDITVRVELVG